MKDPKRPFLVATEKVQDDRGLVGILEDHSIPFKVRRTFWVAQVPDNTWRGGHAHKSSEQLLICTHGQIRAELEDINGSCYKFDLTSETPALYIPVNCWGRFLFTSEATAMCLASDHFDEKDYIRSYSDFEKLRYASNE